MKIERLGPVSVSSALGFLDVNAIFASREFFTKKPKKDKLRHNRVEQEDDNIRKFC